MISDKWDHLVLGALAVFFIVGGLNRIARGLGSIVAKLDTIIDLLHRIRINDRDRDF